MVFTLSQEQFAAFEGHARYHWCQTAATNLFEVYEPHYTAFGAYPETLLPMVHATASWAERYEILSRADVTRLCHVAASLGHRFWQDPRFQRYVKVSTASSVPAGRRATAMIRETKGWLRALWVGDSLQAFSERLAELVAAGRGPEDYNLHQILPGHWQLFSAADNERLLAWLAQSAPGSIRDAGPRQLTYTACALVHGPKWLSEPQYPRLAALVQAESDPASLAAQIADLYAAATA